MRWVQSGPDEWVNLEHAIRARGSPDGGLDVATIDGTIARHAGPYADAIRAQLRDLDASRKPPPPPEGAGEGIDRETTAGLIVSAGSVKSRRADRPAG